MVGCWTFLLQWTTLKASKTNKVFVSLAFAELSHDGKGYLAEVRLITSRQPSIPCPKRMSKILGRDA